MAKIGTLFSCATPIGNLNDTSHRLISTLEKVDLILAEDTRVTAKLLAKFQIKKTVLRLDKHTENKQLENIKTWLLEGKDIAIVSDAGTPGVSDPGSISAKCAFDLNAPVIPIPGPSAVTTLLSVTPRSDTAFTFLGFFERKEDALLKQVNPYISTPGTIIGFESAKRLEKTLLQLQEHTDIETITLGKELTKQFETIITGSPEEVMKKLKDIPQKGEWTVVITFKETPPEQNDKEVEALIQEGFSPKDIKKIAKVCGWQSNAAYQMALRKDTP